MDIYFYNLVARRRYGTELTEMMNHRLGERLRVDLPAVLHPLDRAPVRARILDASLSGLGVWMQESAQNFHIMAPLEVNFFLPRQGGDWDPMDLHTFMVRRSRGVMGLMLAVENPELMWCLRSLTNARLGSLQQELPTPYTE